MQSQDLTPLSQGLDPQSQEFTDEALADHLVRYAKVQRANANFLIHEASKAERAAKSLTAKRRPPYYTGLRGYWLDTIKRWLAGETH